MTATCSHCYQPRDPSELLIVTETGGLHRSKYVCRPGAGLPDPGRCFREAVGMRLLETIQTAEPEAPLLPLDQFARGQTDRSVDRPAPDHAA